MARTGRSLVCNPKQKLWLAADVHPPDRYEVIAVGQGRYDYVDAARGQTGEFYLREFKQAGRQLAEIHHRSRDPVVS